MTSSASLSAMESVASRLAEIRRRMNAACVRAGRDPASVVLVGASKRQPLERLREAYDAGLRAFGENIAQEAVGKQGDLPADIDWHFFGPLQSNKVRLAVRSFSTLHAVDRLKIGRLLDRESVGRETPLRIFLQVHLGDEPSKHGFDPTDLAETLRPLADLEHVEIVGLMAIPPYEEDPELARAWFRRLREHRDALSELPEWSGWQGWLSMGMSDDFEIAIEEGATHVRVGSALFGDRES